MALTDVYHSRPEVFGQQIRAVRIFECPSSDLSAGEGGWTATGMPTIGDAYPYGTWTANIKPYCGNVEVEPRFLVGIARITATYWAPLSRAGAV